MFKRKQIDNIKTASVHPGVVDTGFGDQALQENGCLRCLKSMFRCCLRNQEEGSQTSVYLCRLAFGELRSGEYYDSDTRVKEMNKRARNL